VVRKQSIALLQRCSSSWLEGFAVAKLGLLAASTHMSKSPVGKRAPLFALIKALKPRATTQKVYAQCLQGFVPE